LYDDVYLVNPRAIQQKVALGRINSIGGVDKFHFMLIPEGWFKVDVRQSLQSNVALMFPKPEAEQETIHDAEGGNVIWNSKYIRLNP
jgi:hypothetical protein